MIRSLALLLSILLHPALATTYASVYIFSSGVYYPFLAPEQQLWMHALVFLLTFLLPISATPIYLRLGWVQSIYMSSHRERVLPLLLSSTVFYVAYYLFNTLRFRGLFVDFVLLSGLLVVLTALISMHWKISAHLTAMGGLVAFVLASAVYLGATVVWALPMVLFAAGGLAAARLYLGAHEPSQVWGGFALGFVVIGLGIRLLSV